MNVQQTQQVNHVTIEQILLEVKLNDLGLKATLALCEKSYNASEALRAEYTNHFWVYRETVSRFLDE